jgi:hypothetical protein
VQDGLVVEPDLYDLMRSHIPEDRHSDFRMAIRDGLRLRHAGKGEEVIGYFGGLPELPEGVEWPGDGKAHYEHVASIDLAKLPALDLNLPESGRISVFGDTDGWAGAFLYFPEGLVLQEAALPADLESGDRVFTRAEMTCAVVSTIPSTSWLEMHLLDADDEDEVFEQLDAFGDKFFTHSWSWHQLGGWANEIQGDRDLGLLPGSAAAQHFYPDGLPSGRVLLAQFDTDSEIGMGWGDFGTLYCFIEPGHLAAHDFADVEVYWECH